MAWFAIYNLTSKDLVSVSQEIGTDAQLAARNLGKVAIAGAPAWTVDQWDGATLAFIPRVNPPDFITPIVTKAQASNVLKNLFETNPTAWTATQEKQALYALLYLAFKDFRNGEIS